MNRALPGEGGKMPAQNAVARRVKEKHRLKRQKDKAKKRGIDTSNPFWQLLLSKAGIDGTPIAANRTGRPR
jgi:hypothetical protein